MKKKSKNLWAGILVTAMVISLTSPYSTSAEAAAKKAKASLSKTRITLTAGSQKKITVKKAKKVKKVKKVKWSVNKKGTKVVKLTGKSKKGVTIKALKKGTATVTAKITIGKTVITKTVKVTVKKKTIPAKTKKPDSGSSNSTPVPEKTKVPVSTEEPETTPAIYGTAGETAVFDKEKANYALDIDASKKLHGISDLLYGIFIEDINFAADGGLYAEMVQNRSFEFTSLASDNEKHAWKNVGTVTAEVVKDDKTGCLNANNPNYMLLKNASSDRAGVSNTGFLDGMAVTKDAAYDFSIYARGVDGYTGPIHVSIMNGNSEIAAADIPQITSGWKKYELQLVSTATSHTNVSLQVTIGKGNAAIDMVSLFPKDTYKGRKNGLRKDLAEKLEALQPAFLRFPGGCVVEGASLDTAYDWKDSIGVGADGGPLKFNDTFGDVAARKQGQNIWTDETATNDSNPSYMTYGLGFYEYFQLAEDIGAVGVPVVNCGMECMIQATGKAPEIGTAEFQQYVQDALDLVEFCRGDKTTKWGAVRVALGHPEPFELPYIAIGNEQWGSKFYTRYEAFVDAFEKAKTDNPELYGNVELIYSAGADDGDSGSDYMPAYREAASWLTKHPGKTIKDFAGAIDHHYYNDPSWFYQHTDYYDEKNYSRDSLTDTQFGGGMQVFLGEYASYSNQWNSALSEAAYMTGLERNGDIVRMAAYAPLFGNLTATHWAPDLIWFNNHTSTASVNYYVQKAFSTNAGTSLLDTTFTGAEYPEKNFKGKVGVGTWSTSAKFDNVKVVDNDTGTLLADDDFAVDDFALNWQKVSDGTWSIKNGELIQSSTTTNISAYGATGSVAYFGDTAWNNYTYTVEATKTGGSEGFLIPFSVKNSKENYFWNIGGWNNTVSCLQQVKNGDKSDQLAGTAKRCVLQNGKKYKLKVVVRDKNVKCYIDNTLYVDYTLQETSAAESYQVVSTDESGDIIIKMVNVTDVPKTTAIDLKGVENVSDTAKVDLVAGKSLKDDNILGEEEMVSLKTSDLTGIAKQFNYTLHPYSVTVLRIKTHQ